MDQETIKTTAANWYSAFGLASKFIRALTPELRRTALRRRVWFNYENLTRRREAVSA